MGLLMYGIREKREAEKRAQEQAQASRCCLREDPTAASRSAIRRQSTIRRNENSVTERRNGRTSPRSVRLSLRNYDIAERDGEVVFARRPPAIRYADAESDRPPASISRRTRRADFEERHWHPSSAQAGSAQTLAEMVALERSLPTRDYRRLAQTLSESPNSANIAAVQSALRERRSHLENILARPEQDQYLPSSRALLNELEEMRRIGSGHLDEETRQRRAQQIDDQRRRVLHLEQLRTEEQRAIQRLGQPVSRPAEPPQQNRPRQIPAYDDLTINARRELDHIMGSLPRVDGLGDRDRSPIWRDEARDMAPASDSESEAEAWDTLLTTITPDDRLPSLESSFNTATAESMSTSASDLSGTHRSASSSRSNGTAATNPSLANLPVVGTLPSVSRLLSPGCEDDDTGMATPDSLPELVRVQRVRSPTDSVRPDHVQGDADTLRDFQTRLDQVDSGLNQSDQLMDIIESRNRDFDGPASPAVDGPAEPGVGPASDAGTRSFDSARRDLEREIEDFRRTRMQRLLGEFMDSGNSEDIPDEVWQSFVPRNVLAGAAGEETSGS